MRHRHSTTYHMGRGWPIGPEDFNVLIASKHFTNGNTDLEAVQKLYDDLSRKLLGSVVQLDMTSMPTPLVKDGERLGHCLNLCDRLERLDLHAIGMDEATSIALFDALAPTALPRLEDLYLYKNEIDDGGFSALARALKRGALHTLKERTLLEENASPGALRALEIDHITSGLRCGDAGLGHAPARSLRSACDA